MRRGPSIAVAAMLLGVLLPAAARANARLVSVTPAGGACVSGPVGFSVEAWSVQPGATYTLRVDRVHLLGGSGGAPDLGATIVGSSLDHSALRGRRIGADEYEFDVTVPPDACGTFSLRLGYLIANAGFVGGRNEWAPSLARLRVTEFASGCAQAAMVPCATTANTRSTWGELKSHYR